MSRWYLAALMVIAIAAPTALAQTNTKPSADPVTPHRYEFQVRDLE